MTDVQTFNLAMVPERYANPPKEIVSKLPRKTKNGGTINLDFVGHGDITLQLIAVDPEWSWEPLVIDPETGGPKITERNGYLVMWGRLNLLGASIVEVGTCEADKGEADKELVGDFLRRAAMRRGFATKLWSKTDREAGLNGAADTNGETRAKAAPKAKAEPAPEPADGPSPEAIELLADVFGVADPAAAEVEPWMWTLAERQGEELDKTRWDNVAKAAKVQPTVMLTTAKELAEKLGKPEPRHLDDIRGQVAVELRRWVLTPADPF